MVGLIGMINNINHPSRFNISNDFLKPDAALSSQLAIFFVRERKFPYLRHRVKLTCPTPNVNPMDDNYIAADITLLLPPVMLASSPTFCGRMRCM